MAQFQKYPMVMTHPNARKGKAVPVKNGNITDYAGVPDFMPPVTVNNEDQEERHAAMGYRPAGNSNPNAYNQAVHAPQPVGFEVQEYPKWVPNGVDEGGKPVSKLVNDAEEEAAVSLSNMGPAAINEFERASVQKTSKALVDAIDADVQAAERSARAKRAANTRKVNKAKAEGASAA